MNKLFLLPLISFSLSAQAKDLCHLRHIKKSPEAIEHTQKIVERLKDYYIHSFLEEANVVVAREDIQININFWSEWTAGSANPFDLSIGHYQPKVKINQVIFKGDDTFLGNEAKWVRHYDELGNFLSKECIIRTSYWATDLHNTTTGVMVIGPKRLAVETKIDLPTE